MDYSLLVGIHNKNIAKNAADTVDGGEPSTSNQVRILYQIFIQYVIVYFA